VIKGLRRTRLIKMMTRDKHQLLTFVCAIVAMMLLLTQNLVAQAAKDVPSTHLAELSRSIEDLSDRVSPAVVQVFASGFRVNPEGGPSDPGLISKTRNVGSGVVMDSEGHVLTNAHVIEGAAAVEVALPALFEAGSPRQSILKGRGRRFSAEIVGVDSDTDLAVLKIPGKGIPFLTFGDSDHVRQGQLVLAFGSPLGLENSVTMGVVSATARQLRPEDPMIYIQTDTPINPGNSGGPLVDLHGHVVGINTFILSQSGGSEGIGFAAPSNIARNVFTQLSKSGQVRRGSIDVYAQSISPELAQGLNLANDWGVILGDVFPGGSGASAGLKEGDVILTLNGKVMENARQLEVNIYRHAIGERISLEVLRGVDKLKVEVAVAARDPDPERFSAHVSVEKNRIQRLGVLGLTLDAKTAQELPPLRKHEGVLVAARVVTAFPGEEQLLPGDVIYAIGRVPVKDLEGLRSSVSALDADKPVVVQLERQGKVRYLTVWLEDSHRR
jgi:serine protease Do